MSPRVEEPIGTVIVAQTPTDIMFVRHIDMPTTVQAIIVKAGTPRDTNFMIKVDGCSCDVITASIVDTTERGRV